MAAPAGFKFKLADIVRPAATGANNAYRQLDLTSWNSLFKIAGWTMYFESQVKIESTASSTGSATVRQQVWYKINNGASTEIINYAETFVHNNVNGKLIPATVTSSNTAKSVSLSLSGVNYLRFRFRIHAGEGSVGSTASGTCKIWLVFPFTTEVTITANKINLMNLCLGNGTTSLISAGSAITRTPYQTAATAASAGTINTTSPLATDLTNLVNKTNAVTKTASLSTITEAQYTATL